MTRSLASCFAVVALTGCAFSSKVERARDAQTFSPSESITLATSPPAGGVRLAKIREKGNQFQEADDCKDRLQTDAQKLGASHVVVTHVGRVGVIGWGAECDGDVYRVTSR